MTPRRRDRDARAAAAIARACGFAQPVAPLIVRRVPDVVKLLAADDTTVRRVLSDPDLRRPVRAAIVASFETVWKQATLERIRLDHPEWLRAWWLPITTEAELERLLAVPAPRSDDRRVGLARGAFPASAAAAELLLDAAHRRELDGYLLVERRVAAAILDLAHEVAHEEGRTSERSTPARGDLAPDGIDGRDHPHVTWWHGR